MLSERKCVKKGDTTDDIGRCTVFMPEGPVGVVPGCALFNQWVEQCQNVDLVKPGVDLSKYNTGLGKPQPETKLKTDVFPISIVLELRSCAICFGLSGIKCI
jgi:hypothetical protein